MFSLLATTLAAALPFGTLLHQPAPSATPSYEHTAQGDLKLYAFTPPQPAAERSPAVIWIHGGGWTGGTCESIFPLARYTAVRGAMSFVVEYRLVKPGQVTVADSISDCQTAVRFVRAHAAEWHVDPARIAVIGESAGGHLAASVAWFGVEATDRSARPDALVLYNPMLDFTGSSFARLLPTVGPGLRSRPLGDDPRRGAESAPYRPHDDGDLEVIRAYSPLFHIRPGMAPTLVVHGLADTVIDPAASRRFAAAMRAAGNRCDLVLLPDTPHAFLIPAYKCSEQVVVAALRRADDFLVSLGWFAGPSPLTVSNPPAWTPKWPPAPKR